MSIADLPRVEPPRSIDDVDAPWLSAALGSYLPGVRVERFEIGEIIHGTCTKIRIEVEFATADRQTDIPTRLMLKTGFEPHSAQLPFMHEAEVRAYRDVLPVLGLRSPACYYADFDAQSGRGAVLMEDLSARGVEFCHPLRPQNPDAVGKRIRSLAAFHAPTWDSEELARGRRWGWVPIMVPEGGGHMAQFTEPAVWQGFVDLPRGRASSVYFQDGAWMRTALAQISKLGTRRPHAVLHGDTHLGNLYIDTDGVPGFFDSLPHRWPGIAEIAYHIGGALDPMDRRAAERDLVKLYLDELEGLGVSAPSLDEAMSDYSAFLAFGFLIFITNASEFQPEAINTAYTARFSAAMIDNDTIDTLAAIS
jgi:hypothetical protein